jgi:hypothetical protein
VAREVVLPAPASDDERARIERPEKEVYYLA